MRIRGAVHYAAYVVALGLLMGSGAAHSEQVIWDGNTATGINDLDYNGVLYDVTFVFETGISVYGPPGQGDFPFDGLEGDETFATEEATFGAGVAIQNALNEASQAITRVGPRSLDYFFIAAAEEPIDPGTEEPQVYGAFTTTYYDDITTENRPEDTWVPADNFFITIEISLLDGWPPIRIEGDPWPFGMAPPLEQDVPYSWAVFAPAGGAPPPPKVDVGGTVTGYLGSGLVLQNNGTGDESIATDGAFVFDRQESPGTNYSVTVQTQPKNPGQKCTVSRGSGSVPAGGVDNIVVTCAAEPLTPDTDGDGVADSIDNCPADANAGQEDDNENGIGNACEVLVPGQTFFDVPPDYWAFDQIETFAASGITGGCGGGNYCPSDRVTRAEMAVFLERAMRGSGYSPPAPQGIFADVPTDYWAAGYIEVFAADGITGGCGGGNFCPDNFTTRAEMAIMLERAVNWPGAASLLPAVGRFADVPIGYWADVWIELLANDGITGGCGGLNFCPEREVLRDEMAVFITNGFGL